MKHSLSVWVEAEKDMCVIPTIFMTDTEESRGKENELGRVWSMHILKGGILAAETFELVLPRGVSIPQLS